VLLVSWGGLVIGERVLRFLEYVSSLIFDLSSARKLGF